MEDKIHPVVRLLAARMESHPDEFFTGNRWEKWMDQLESVITEEERVLLRKYKMDRMHEEVMDELLNGDERRAEAARQAEEQRQNYLRQHAAAQQQYASIPTSVTTNNLQGVMNQLQNVGMSTSYDAARQMLMVKDPVTGIVNQLPVDDLWQQPTTTTGLLGAVKKGLGIK